MNAPAKFTLLLDTAAQAVASAAAAHIRNIQGRVIADVAEIGKALLQVKEALGHGNFTPWLKAEFGWTERTAQNYISVAERFGPNTKCVSHLPIATVYRLAAPSTPEPIRDRIVTRLEAGEVIAPADIADEIAVARRAEDREREEAQKSPAARAREKAAREHYVQVRQVGWARQQQHLERKITGRGEAARIVVAGLQPDDLARLIQLLAERDIYISQADLVAAQSRKRG